MSADHAPIDEAPGPERSAGDAATHDAPGPTADAVTAWTSVLDALEDMLDTLEAAAETIPDEEAADPELLRRAAAAVDWAPPRVDTPIPAALVARAQSISERQQAVLTRLTADADTLRRHRSAVGSVRAATVAQESAVYLDVTG